MVLDVSCMLQQRYEMIYLCDDRLTEADAVAVFKGRLKTHRFNSYFSPASQPHSL